MQYLNFKCLKKVVYLCMWRKIALTERPGNGVHHRQIIGLSIPVIPRKCWPDAITWFDSVIFYFYRRFHLCCFYFRTKLWNPIGHWQWQDCGTQEDPITFMVTIDLLGYLEVAMARMPTDWLLEETWIRGPCTKQMTSSKFSGFLTPYLLDPSFFLL